MSDRPSRHLPPLLPRRHPADLGFMVLAAAAFGLLLFLGSRMTFHSDEWNVIAVPPGGTPEGWFAPYNEHWATVLYLVYRGLNGIVGLRSYLPYIGLLLIVHVLAAGGLYRLLSLATSRWVALAGASIVLVLGNAYQDLFWGWQVGFVGSTAAGVWALAALAGARRPRNAAGAAMLLTLAVATSGIGLAFLGAALVLEVARPDRRREVLWLVIPVVAYAAWYALIGRTGISVNNNPFTVQAAAMVPGFVAASVGHAVAATFGLEPRIGAAATALGVTLVALSLAPPTWRPSRLRSLDPELSTIRDGLAIVLGALFGLLVLFSLIGLTRAQRGPDAALEPRYVYPAAVLVLTAVGGAVGQRTVHPPSRRSPALLAALILVVALAGNLQALEMGRQIFLGYADEVRALTALVERYQDAPAVDPNRALWPMPKPAELLALLRREGWPVSNPPGDVSGIPPDAVDRALVQLVGSSFSVSPGPDRAGVDPTGSPPPEPLGWDAYSGMTVTESEGCLWATTKPPHGLLILHVPDGAALSIEGPVGAPFDVSLGRFVDPQPSDGRQAAIAASGSSIVLVPRLADGQPWKLEFGLPVSKTWRLCLTAHP